MGTRLYIGNLSYGTTEEMLRSAFETGGGTVSDVHIIMDRDTGRSRGFGFVEMASDNEAQAAIEAMDGFDLDGRQIRVNEAREKAPRSGGGGGGPRSGRGHGGNGYGGRGGGRRY